jgi:DNA replication and repair protein RecF
MLTAITLQNFRTYKKRTVSLHPRLTLIIGPNAIGKTNILEAMYALAIGKSFRAEKEEEVITWEEEIGRVIGKTEEDTLELLVTHGVVGGEYAPKKRFMVNGVTRRLIDFTGKMPAVLFWPEDLSLVIDSPSTRREYLNRVLIQIDREYRRNLYQYEKGLRHADGDSGDSRLARRWN